MAKLQRRLRLGMVGGGPGAFIGAVHRMAARLDDRFELVAAALVRVDLRRRRGLCAVACAGREYRVRLQRQRGRGDDDNVRGVLRVCRAGDRGRAWAARLLADR